MIWLLIAPSIQRVKWQLSTSENWRGFTDLNRSIYSGQAPDSFFFVHQSPHLALPNCSLGKEGDLTFAVYLGICLFFNKEKFLVGATWGCTIALELTQRAALEHTAASWIFIQLHAKSLSILAMLFSFCEISSFVGRALPWQPRAAEGKGADRHGYKAGWIFRLITRFCVLGHLVNEIWCSKSCGQSCSAESGANAQRFFWHLPFPEHNL